MSRFGYLAPVVSLALFATACSNSGEDETATASQTGTDTATTDPDTTGSPTTTPSTDGTDSADTGSGETTDPSADSSGDGGCTPADECMSDADCNPGQQCGPTCTCLGEQTGCLEWGTGNYEACVMDGEVNNGMCAGMPVFCLVDNTTTPTAGVCTNTNCTEKCDCGQPPEGFDEQVICDDLTGDMMGDCYLSCENGEECPENMFCLANLFCTHGEPPPTLDPYGDCFTMNGVCPNDGACLSDSATFGVCTHGCQSDADCREAPATGNAPVACIDVADLPGNECYLDCANGEDCPDGMICHDQAQVCVWPPAPDPYGDCENNPPTICLDTEECTSGQVSGTDASVCSTTGCTDVNDCPAAPATGDAVLTCGDLGNGNVCYLDCTKATCPDGMACSDNNVCMWESMADALPEPGLTCNVDQEPLKVRKTPALEASIINY